MHTVNTVLNAPLSGFFALFGLAPRWLSLGVLSALAGVAMLWVFGKTSDQAAIRAAKRRLYAHLFELRLYADDPLMMWRAQRDLLKANLRYFALMLRPALILTIPMLLLLVRLDAWYGRAPLAPGRAAVVTLRLAGTMDGNAPPPKLTAPAAVVVETPPVRVLAEREVSWRIRPAGEVSDKLRFRLGDETLEKRVEAGRTFRFVPGRRSRSYSALLLDPGEPRLASSAVEWIDVRYPDAAVNVFGLEVHWLVWFLVVSMLTAVVLRKRFGVVF